MPHRIPAGVSKQEIILSMLKNLYPEKQIPHGGLTKLAEVVGCTREYVRQVAKTHNYKVHARESKKDEIYCASCLRRRIATERMMYCTTCRVITILCDYCEKPLFYSEKEYLRKLKGQKTTRTFCSRTHAALFDGKVINGA